VGNDVTETPAGSHLETDHQRFAGCRGEVLRSERRVERGEVQDCARRQRPPRQNLSVCLQASRDYLRTRPPLIGRVNLVDCVFIGAGVTEFCVRRNCLYFVCDEITFAVWTVRSHRDGGGPR